MMKLEITYIPTIRDGYGYYFSVYIKYEELADI